MANRNSRGSTKRPALRSSARPVRILSFPGPPLAEWPGVEVARAAEALSDAAAAREVLGLVLTGPRLFAETTAVPPAGHADPLLSAIVACRIPVVAAACGTSCSGLGLELALACRSRVVAHTVRLGLPGIHLGELPVHGAVERLPALIGLPAAMDLLAFGEVLDAAAAHALGLVDAVAAEPELMAVATGFAEGTASAARPDAGDVRRWLHDVPAARARLAARLPAQAAPAAALHALESGLRLPFPRALAETRQLAGRLRASAQAASLRRCAALDRLLPAPAELACLLRWALLREAVHLLDDGATPAEVDRALFAFGFTLLPFAAADRDGFPSLDGSGLPWHSYSPLVDLLRDAGRPWHRPGPDPELNLMLRESSMAQRLRRRAVDDAEIVSRCLAALLAAGVRALEAGHGADLVDAAANAALGFPRWRGGLLHHAAASGVATIVERLDRMHAGRGTVDAPSSLLRRAALDGRFPPPRAAHMQ